MSSRFAGYRLETSSATISADLLDVADGISPEQRHDPHTGFKGLAGATAFRAVVAAGE